MNYLQLFISAKDIRNANEMLDMLLKRKTIAGGLILKGPSKFWWKKQIVQTEYYNISAFTTEKYQESIISLVRKVSPEEVPMIWFIKIYGNKEFLRWIDQSIG